MWNWRMLMLKRESRYADMMELSLYNSVRSGVSLDGSAYFYQNPLSDDGSHRRERWFAVACCPSNLSRMLAQLPGYFYTTSPGGVWVQLYAASSASIDMPNGMTVNLTQRTDYPWSGDIEIQTETAGTYNLFLRVPGWCDSKYALTINGKPANADLLPSGYLKVSREWQAGDTLKLALPMDIRRIESHPFITENQGRVALMCGPLLYCIENADNLAFDVRLLNLPIDGLITAKFEADMLDGVTVLRGSATLLPTDDGWTSTLYRPARQAPSSEARRVEFTAIPYYAWANREPGPMQVWIRSS